VLTSAAGSTPDGSIDVVTLLLFPADRHSRRNDPMAVLHSAKREGCGSIRGEFMPWWG
jgi:hypothetical protein